MTEVGPKAHRRRTLDLVRVIFWFGNLVLMMALFAFARTAFDAVSIPYLLAISLFALIEGAWSSYSAESPLDE